MDKKIVSIMKKIYVQKTTLRILQNFMIKDNVLYMTNLDCGIKVNNFTGENGIYSFEKFSKTFDLEFSKLDIDVAEFPEMDHYFENGKILLSEKQNILPALIGCAGYCSDDYTSRVSLTGSLINADFVVSTTGHILKEIYHGHKINFPKDIKELIAPNGKNLKSGMIYKDLSKLGNFSLYYHSVSSEYIEFKNKDLSFYIKLIEGPYPDYKKVIPDDKSTALKTTDISSVELLDAIEKIKTALPYAHYKTKQIGFIDDNMVMKSDEGIYKKIPFTGNFINKLNKKVGLNGFYLTQILSDLKAENSGSISLESGSALGAKVFRCSNYVYVLMPLRLLDEE